MKQKNLRQDFGDTDFDIMRVYRDPDGGVVSFNKYDEEALKRSAEARKEAYRSGKVLCILAQAFYGNRTVTEIFPDRIDSFILGWLDAEMAKAFIKPEDIDRTIVRIPGTENLVLIYNKYQDEENKKDGIRMTASIPELGLELHSRCIVCRMIDDGSFRSIENEDFEKVMKYLAE